jgi:hypothetical protein
VVLKILAAGRALPLTSRFTSEIGQVVGCIYDVDVYEEVQISVSWF